MRCGLLGKKLGHSYSPQIHSYLADYTYDLFEKMPEELEGFLKQGDFTGLNVTMPYKKDVIPYLDELSDRAAELGAVNTIVRRKDGTLIGRNTDYFGFQSMLNRSGLQVKGKKVLVLGSGGASATAVAVLKKHGAKVIVISRNSNNNYSNNPPCNLAIGVNIHNGIVATICKHIVTNNVAISIQITIRIKKPSPFGIIVSALQIIPSGLYIVIVSAVSERVNFIDNLPFKTRGRRCYCEVTPCIVGICTYLCAIGIINSNNIALEIFFKEIAVENTFGVRRGTVFKSYG